VQRLHATLTYVSLVFLGCDRQSGFITETSLFVEVRMPTERTEGCYCFGRAERFARAACNECAFRQNNEQSANDQKIIGK